MWTKAGHILLHPNQPWQTQFLRRDSDYFWNSADKSTKVWCCKAKQINLVLDLSGKIKYNGDFFVSDSLNAVYRIATQFGLYSEILRAYLRSLQWWAHVNILSVWPLICAFAPRINPHPSSAIGHWFNAVSHHHQQVYTSAQHIFFFLLQNIHLLTKLVYGRNIDF